MKFKVLDLFSGIGGFSLGLERTNGFETVAFCEIDPFCRSVLRKHWPDVKQYTDIRELTVDVLRRDGIEPDVICGGFPCQDISTAGKGIGIKGERSGLWKEYARLIGELRPKYAIVENVSALLSRGLSDVLGDLAEIGYDAEWHCIPASAVGAPHRRDRIWIVAHANNGFSNGQVQELCSRGNSFNCSSEDVADSYCKGLEGFNQWESSSKSKKGDRVLHVRASSLNENLPNAMCQRLERQRSISCGIAKELNNPSYSCGWISEPNVGRVAVRVPNRVDRLRSLGNSVVPQIPELLGKAILEFQNSSWCQR